jgi:hypothetical protein
MRAKKYSVPDNFDIKSIDILCLIPYFIYDPTEYRGREGGHTDDYHEDPTQDRDARLSALPR